MGKWKQKISFILIAFILIGSQWNVMDTVGISTVYGATEAGTPDNPILISTAEEFDNIRHDLDKHYKLDVDIDLSSFEDWTPIGATGNEFTGSLDGSGYHIKNVTIMDGGPNTHIGLFGFIKNGEINNLTLENVQIEIDPTKSNVNTGSLAGEIDGTQIDNVHISSGPVFGGDANTGGFAGKIKRSEISNSSANVTVKGFDFIGGFAGFIENSEVENSYSLGNVSVHPDGIYDDGTHIHSFMAGGFVGQLDNSTLRRVFADGNVIGPVTYAGGLIGQSLGSNSQIVDVYATGDVKQAKAFMGGLIGHNVDVMMIDKTFAVGELKPDGEPENAAGLIGLNESGAEITNSYWNKDIYESSDEGTGLTTPEMQDSYHFKDWDFRKTWYLNGGPYPVLRLVEQITIEPNAHDDYKLQNNAIHFDEINETYHLKIINGLYPNGIANFPIWNSVTLTSSDPSVARVSNDRVITAIKGGSAEIYVQHPGLTLILHIYVHEEPREDYALKFDGKQDGTGSFVKVAHDESLKNTKDFTVETWVNWDGTDGYRVFLSKPQTATTTGWAFVINDGKPEFHAQLGSPNINNPIGAYEPIEANTWNHLAFSYDGHSGDAKLYINGERKGWTNWGLTDILQKEDTPLLMGREFESHLPERSFGGYIDNVRIWSTVLSDGAVADWHNRINLDKHPNRDHLVGNWNFNEGEGNIAGDGSGYKNMGQLINHPQWADKADDMILAELNQAIEIAEQKLIDHPEGFEIGEAPPEAREALQEAIDTAEERVKNSVGKTDEEIDNATNMLQAAIRAFEEKVVTEHSLIEFAGGDGTINSPYLIKTPDQLNKIRGNLSAHYKLITDIDLTDWDWIPIGTFTKPFQGGFDGNGKVISNLTIDLPDQNEVGLFGIVGGSTIRTYIKNTGLENVDIKGNRFVGALVGRVLLGGSGGKKVSNSYVKDGNVTGAYGSTGGLIGALGQAEELQNSYAINVNVTGGSTVGGLVGGQDGIIENVYSIGEVKATSPYEYNLGGLVGRSNEYAKNENAYWHATCDGCSFTNSFGEEKTVVELKQRKTFVDWDFDSTWLLYDGFDFTPKLQVFHPLEHLDASIEFESVAEEEYFFPDDTAQIHVSATHKGLDPFDLTGNQAVEYDVITGTDVITITEKGKITASNPGTAKISVQLSGQEEELTLDVDRLVPEMPTNLIVPETAQKGETTVEFTWDEPDRWGVGTENSYDVQFFDGSKWDDFVSVDVTSYTYTLPKDINTEEAKFRVRSVTDKGRSEFVESAIFIIDNTAPTMEFETNGSEAWSQTVSTSIVLEDNLSGINTDSLYFIWDKSQDTPAENDDWREFALDEKPQLDDANGDWYLHVKVRDNAGNQTFDHSKRFRLDSQAPLKPEIVLSHDVAEWLTNPPVKFTIIPGEDEDGGGVEKTVYRTQPNENDWSEWKPKLGEAILVTEDGMTNIEAQTIDVAGNRSEVAKETIKIDTQTPNKPNIQLDPDGWSKDKVEVTIEKDGETVSEHAYIEYTDDLDATDWTKYEPPFTIDTNGVTTIYARAVNHAGTKSKPAEAIVKIDSGTPTINVKMITTGDGKDYVNGSWTNQDVQLSAEITNEISDITESEILFNFTYMDFDGTMTISDEGEHRFILIVAKNEAGGSRQAGPFDVLIDKTAPDAPTIKPSTTKWTNERVTVEIEDGVDSGRSGVAKTEYKIGEKGQWQTYEGSFQISEEGEHYIYARTWDKAGNVTPLDNLAKTIVRIAMTEPSMTIHAETDDGEVYEPDTWTNQTVTLEAIIQAETDVPLIMEYSTDGNTWKEYKEAITISEEGETVIHFRAEDEAGNVADTMERIVKIDRTPPSQPTIDLSHEDWANEPVIVTLTAGNDEKSGSSQVIYQMGDSGWLPYTEPFKISSNGETTVYAKTVDHANNESDSKEATVFIEQRLPDMTLHGEKTIIMEEGTTYYDEGGKASHQRFGNLTEQIITKSNLDTNDPGTYTITYTVVDPAGNKASISRTIHVLDIDKIEIGDYASLVEENGTVQIKVEPVYLDEKLPSITHTPLFLSHDESIATVDKNGLVHFHKAGRVTISITYGPIQKTLDFTVDDGYVELSEKREVLAGGTYTIRETGAEIIMPADLPIGTMVTVENMDVGHTNHDMLILVGDVLTITFHFPEGASLLKGHYTLVMSYSEQANPDKVGIYYYNEKTKKWEYRGGDVDKENRRITLAVPHFSTYAVFEEQDNEEQDYDEDKPSNDTGKDGNDAKEDHDSEGENDPGENSENVSQGDEKATSENKLPTTATSTYNWLLWGVILFFVGLTNLFVRMRETKQ